MKSIFGRWLPERRLTDITNIRSSKAVLGIAGLAFVGAGIAGPTAASFGHTDAPAPQASVATALVSYDKDSHGTSPDTSGKNVPPGTKALTYDYERQPNFFYCGPAATRIALTALGHAPSFDQVAKKLGTTENGTNSAVDTTRVLNKIDGGHFYTTHTISGAKATGPQMDELRTSVVRAVATGHPVVANIAGTVTDTGGNTHSYEGGHYLTIVGYSDGGMTVKIADPADDKGNGSYNLPVGTMANWIATRGYSA